MTWWRPSKMRVQVPAVKWPSDELSPSAVQAGGQILNGG